ncbi:MAG: endolytic transglycosylase MltG [Candidatus Dormibacteria bacterium]
MRDGQRGRLGVLFALIGVVVVLALLAGGVFVYGGIELKPADTGSEAPTVVRVSPGESLDQLASGLESEGLIKSALFFSAYARIRGVHLHAGLYRVDSAMGASEIINVLEGPQYCPPVSFVIPEGFTIDQIADRVAATKGLDISATQYLAALAQTGYTAPFLSIRPAGDTSLEGFLFPATYTVPDCATAHQVIQEQLSAFQSQIVPKLPASPSQAYDDLITASIIQAEARFAADFPLVASVVDNRLADNMDLQIDAIVMYGLHLSGQPMSTADEAIPTPYNSYQNPGLPPTPIDSPGLATLEGALAPATTTYLFYVTDPCGHNHYSVTEAVHEQQVQEYSTSC